jgi:mRNA interferase MazF
VTHIRIGRQAGATKYVESFVNCTDLHSIAKPSLRRRLGRLAPVEMRSVEAAVRVILGL